MSLDITSLLNHKKQECSSKSEERDESNIKQREECFDEFL